MARYLAPLVITPTCLANEMIARGTLISIVPAPPAATPHRHWQELGRTLGVFVLVVPLELAELNEAGTATNSPAVHGRDSRRV